MVRYSEIIKESVDIERIEGWIEDFLKIRGQRNIYIDPSDGSVSIEADSVTIRETFNSRFPMKFRKITGNFNVINKGLKTLQDGPTEIIGDYNISTNNLTSLEGLANIITGILCCHSNDLTSLEGLNEKSKINRIFISYSKTLPLLRLLVSQNP